MMEKKEYTHRSHQSSDAASTLPASSCPAIFFLLLRLCAGFPASPPCSSLTLALPSSPSSLFLFSPAPAFASPSPAPPFARAVAVAAAPPSLGVGRPPPDVAFFFFTLSGFGPFGPFFFFCAAGSAGAAAFFSASSFARSGADGRCVSSSAYVERKKKPITNQHGLVSDRNEGRRPHRRFGPERRVARRLEDHDRPVDVHERHGGHRAQLRAERLRLARDRVPVLVRLACECRA
jgi:hypothetical protein